MCCAHFTIDAVFLYRIKIRFVIFSSSDPANRRRLAMVCNRHLLGVLPLIYISIVQAT